MMGNKTGLRISLAYHHAVFEYTLSCLQKKTLKYER